MLNPIIARDLCNESARAMHLLMSEPPESQQELAAAQTELSMTYSSLFSRILSLGPHSFTGHGPELSCEAFFIETTTAVSEGKTEDQVRAMMYGAASGSGPLLKTMSACVPDIYETALHHLYLYLAYATDIHLDRPVTSFRSALFGDIIRSTGADYGVISVTDSDNCIVIVSEEGPLDPGNLVLFRYLAMVVDNTNESKGTEIGIQVAEDSLSGIVIDNVPRDLVEGIN